MSYDAASPGVVALAAYKPDPELFQTQLRSIQDQTHSNFICLISADGGADEVKDLVTGAVGADVRFRVVGFTERFGFYGNFERVLKHVPEDADWVALSDQDDSWYPDKLERLIRHLENVSLVAAQARVVRQPGTVVVSESTQRRNVALGSLIAQNQVTGSLCLFRRDLLDLALPFPRLDTITQVHDHWLAVCAAASDGWLVVDDVVQDYIQHGGNVLGEVESGKGLAASFRHLGDLSEKYRGSRKLVEMLRTANDLSFGWRRAMADNLEERYARKDHELNHAIRSFSTGHSWGATARTLVTGLRRGEIAMPCFVEFMAGLPVELVSRGRGSRRP